MQKQQLIKGYKALDKNKKNRYGLLLEENHIYTTTNPLVFGNNGNGFHFCKNLEDTLRYVPAMEEEISIARVASLGEVCTFNDEYYGFYDMYATNIIKIEKYLTREEIIKIILSSNEVSVLRFVKLFKLSRKELDFFKNKYTTNTQIQNAIKYYQEKDLDTYKKYYGYSYRKK